LFKFRRIDVRAHWTLFLIVIYDMVSSLRHGAPWWMAVVIIFCLFGSILLHEFGHSLTARVVGGNSNRIVLWMLGGLAECYVPPRAGAHFLVAAAGPAVTAAIAGLAYGATWMMERSSMSNLWYITLIVGYLASLNFRLLMFNLIPCYPLDGGRIYGSALWAFVGAHRAQRIVMFTSYPAIAGLFAWSIWSDSFIGLFVSLWLLSEVIMEHTKLRQGESAAFGVEAWGEARTSRGWWQRWKQRRQQRAAEQVEREETAEQDVLDRLLAKVSEHGLPSLTAAERSQLERISKRQRQRQGQ